MSYSYDLEAAIEALRNFFGDRLSTSKALREHHSADESWHAPSLPDAVLNVLSTDDVVQAVKICAKHKMPIVPFGAGSSLEGQVIPVNGGLTLNFTEMNQVLEIRPEDFDVSVQPGVTRKQLNTELRHMGLMFPVDPGADATIGGMASTRASGTTSVLYGTMKDNVVALTVVTADGRVIKSAQRARKSSAGYDLTHLFVGAEGTLGIITEITLRLHPIPEAVSTAVTVFPSISDAVQATISTLQHAVPIARIELLDDLAIAAVNTHMSMNHPVQPTLFLEFHGSSSAVSEQAELVGEICSEFGADNFTWKTDEEDKKKLWEARHNAVLAVMAGYPGRRLLGTDVCVPISRLADIIEAAQENLRRDQIHAPLMGHVGDGNFHFSIPVDPDNEEEFRKIKSFCYQLASDAIEMDGTCTGEHGIGLGKQDFLLKELGPSVDYMIALKKAFDPDNILNPGKIFSEKQ